MWKHSDGDIEVAMSEWLPEWNVPPTERYNSRPFCSVHWTEDAEKGLLPEDKIFRRETKSKYKESVIHLLERRGKIVAISEQVFWQMVE